MKRQVLGRQCRGPVFLIGGVVSRTAFAHEAPLSRSYADGTALFCSGKARSFDGRCSSETSDPQRRKNLSKCLPSGANSCKKTQRLLRKIAGKIICCNERQQNGTFHPSSFTGRKSLPPGLPAATMKQLLFLSANFLICHDCQKSRRIHTCVGCQRF